MRGIEACTLNIVIKLIFIAFSLRPIDCILKRRRSVFVLETLCQVRLLFCFRYGDMRVTMGCEIFSMWQNLGKWWKEKPPVFHGSSLGFPVSGWRGPLTMNVSIWDQVSESVWVSAQTDDTLALDRVTANSLNWCLSEKSHLVFMGFIIIQGQIL